VWLVAAKTTVFKSIRFNHNSPLLSQALGLTPRQAELVERYVIDLIHHRGRVSEVVEEILNNSGLSDAEKVYAIYTLGFILGRGAALMGH
jgi:hypothetical protein